MVRYYGHYSNASRGHWQKKNFDDLILSILEPGDLKPNRTWARLIQKIYEVDPLTCTKLPGADENLGFYRGRRGDREDSQASWPLGEHKGETPGQREGALPKDFHR